MSDEKRAPALPWTCAEIPKILTYIHPGPEPWEPRYQLQWDYQIEWPSGLVEKIPDVAADRIYTIVEGRGIQQTDKFNSPVAGIPTKDGKGAGN